MQVITCDRSDSMKDVFFINVKLNPSGRKADVRNAQQTLFHKLRQDHNISCPVLRDSAAFMNDGEPRAARKESENFQTKKIRQQKSQLEEQEETIKKLKSDIKERDDFVCEKIAELQVKYETENNTKMVKKDEFTFQRRNGKNGLDLVYDIFVAALANI